MGLYINGMEMPKSCHACCFFWQDYIWTIGKIKDVERKAKELCPERDPDNPLLPARRD